MGELALLKRISGPYGSVFLEKVDGLGSAEVP